ncbi:MAG: ABC transporter ATP-binding protein [Alphaproteobacteria bacterium]
MAGISLRSIRKSFKQTAVLHGVSLDIADGEFISLVGPSGCGKTTLLRIIAGLEHQDDGDVYIGNRMVDDLPPKARDIAMVFQSYALYPYMTVAENIALPLTMRRMSALQRLPIMGRFAPGATQARTAIEQDVKGVADGLGIGHLLARKPAQLSGGQRQRVALARAMVRSPQAFLMDEPLSNLDAKLRVQARTEIAELHRRLNTTFVYVTHDQAEAMTMSDRVAVMMGGHLLQVAPPQTIYDDPTDLAVATFIGTPQINTLPGVTRADGAIDVLGRTWTIGAGVPGSAPLTVAVRPEAFVVHRGALPHPCAVTGTIRNVERLGAETLVHVAVDGLDKVLIARSDPGFADGLRLGETATLAAFANRVLLFDRNGKRMAAHPRPAIPALREAVNG